MSTLKILDAVLRDIDEQVAAHAPERGGALLTVPGELFITRFLLDEEAETSGASYRPSRELNCRVQELEEYEDLQFGGILHSHPGGLDHPSGQDERELATGLRLNPHLPGYLAPIVTRDAHGLLEDHELPLTGAKVSFFIAERDGDGGVTVRPQPVTVARQHSVGPVLATDTSVGADLVRAGLFARTTGLLSETLTAKHVLVVGLGSVGSQAAEGLVRAGVGRLTLLDPDVVEPANLSRTVYLASDVGRPKADALRDRLLAINPGLVVDSATANLLDLDLSKLDALVQRADLVVAATDDPGAQRALNRFAYGRGTPALFIGIYAGAQGGEAVISVTGRTACYLCATFVRHTVEAETSAVQPHADYGTGRLPGEVALGADIQHVVSASVKLALALLVRGESVGLGGFLEPVLADGSSYLTLGMVPDYWFYPDVFAAAAGQFAYQSVWLTPTRRHECPVCGVEPLDLLSVPLRAPQVGSLRQRRPVAQRSAARRPATPVVDAGAGPHSR